MRRFLIILIYFLFLPFGECQSSTLDLVRYSGDLIYSLEKEVNVAKQLERLKIVSLSDAIKSLNTDEKKLAFWINIYNAFIVIRLREDPDQYQDKGSFYKKEQIPIFGLNLSFDQVEHGILRRSEYKYFLGYLKRFFVSDWEKALRVDKKDGRIHFALNCGAKDCPPIDLYEYKTVNAQLDANSKRYLKIKSDYDSDKSHVKTTPLFKWFIGDFGGSEGVRKYLQRYEIYPEGKEVKVTVNDYDWTLSVGDFKF